MMIFIATVLVTFGAAIAQAAGVPFFAPAVTVPVAGIVAMCLMGVTARLHPVMRASLVAMVPRRVPVPAAMVWFTGACELAGGIGVLFAPTRVAAALCLVALLVCVFPANVVDARRKGADDGSGSRRIIIRGVQQLAFIALCVWCVLLSR